MRPQGVKPLHIPAGLPIDEATRPEMLDVGMANTSNVNVRMNNRKILSKRRGYTWLSTTRLDGTTRTAGRRMFMKGQQLCVIDGTVLDVYSDTTGRSSTKGSVSECEQRPIKVPTVGNTATLITDSVSLNGYVVTSWVSGTPQSFAYVSVIDGSTYAVIRNPEIIGPTSASSLLMSLTSYDSYVIAVIFNISTSSVVAYYLDTSSGTTVAAGWVSIGTLASDLAGYRQAVSLQGVSRFAIVYANNSGGASQITAKACTIAGVVQSTTLNTSGGSPGELSVVEGGTTLWVVWEESGFVKGQGLDPAAITSTLATKQTIFNSGVTVIDIRVAPMGSGNAAVYVNANAPFFSFAQAIKISAGATATNGALATIGNSRIVSRPILRNGLIYAHYVSGNSKDLVLCECTPDTTGVAVSMYLRPVAVPIQRELFVTGGSPGGERIAAVGSTGRYVFAYNVQKSGTTNGSAMTEYNFASAQEWEPAIVNGACFLGGGVTSVFDGTRVFEAGFLCRPPTPSLVTSNAGSLTFTLGGRSYVATYEDVDADGNWHVSGVSNPVISGNVSSKRVDVTIAPLSITSRGTRNGSSLVYGSVSAAQRIGIWATKDGGVAPYYRLAEMTNDPGVTGLTYTDNISDGTLAAGALIYGSGALPGVSGSSQDHRAPPGLARIIAYNGMIVGSNGNTLWFSSQPIDGQGTWFSPVFTQSGTVDDEITGLAVQDGSIVVFCRRSLYVTNGDVPADNGTSGGLATLRKLAIDQGCINANSILTTSMGTFYQSDRGLELLTRGQTNAFVGLGIQNELATYPIVTSATLDTLSSLARFTLATSQTSALASTNGKDVIFDLTQNAWVSVDDKRGSVATQASQDSTMAFIGGSWRYAWLATDGTVYFERPVGDAAECVDGSSWVTGQYEMPPLKLGLQQEMRIWEMEALFERASACGLTIEMAYDFGAYNGAVDKVWTEAQLAGLRQVDFRPDPLRSALQLRVRDTAPAVLGTGKGLIFIGMSADAAPKQGTTRGTPRLAATVRR